MPQETSFSYHAVWLTLHTELSSTLWEDDDLDSAVHGRNDDIITAARALQFVYNLEWKGVEAEDSVLATIKAAQEFHGGTQLTASQVREMAENFAVHYNDRLESMDDYLEEHCGEVRWHWLNDHGQREIEKAVIKDSEIWIEDVNVSSDVWVFNAPGTT